MRFVTRAAVLCLMLALIAPAATMAQDDEPTKLNVRIGLFRPLDTQTQTFNGKTWSCEGLIYDLKLNDNGRPTTQVELGLIESIDSADSAMMLGANKLWWQKPTGTSLYYGAGAGVAKFKVFGQSKLEPTGQLFVGFNVSDSYFFELRALIVPPIDIFGIEVKMSGIMLTAGTRKLF
ncbi:MAG: hypothetical protein Q7T82_15730 [Armatimonadota bacterium]|nr:hypothetical protein [Armatimonadota bacterium]